MSAEQIARKVGIFLCTCELSSYQLLHVSDVHPFAACDRKRCVEIWMTSGNKGLKSKEINWRNGIVSVRPWLLGPEDGVRILVQRLKCHPNQVQKTCPLQDKQTDINSARDSPNNAVWARDDLMTLTIQSRKVRAARP